MEILYGRVESTVDGEYNNTNNFVINTAIGDIVDQPIFFLCRTRRNLTKNSIRGRRLCVKQQ
jgi:hypothetical protein